MKFTPRRKFIKGQISPDAAKILDATPKSWGEIERLIKSYLSLTGGTITGNLAVTGNTQLGNAATDTVGLYDATAVARQNHITDAPEITSANTVAAAAATATTIAATVPAAAPAGGTGAAAGAWDTAADRNLAITTINDLRTHAIEMDLDYEALLVDVADIRTKYAAAVTLINELKADVNLARTAINTILVGLETIGINKTS